MKKIIIASVLALFLLFILLTLSKNKIAINPDYKIITEMIIMQDDVIQLFYKTNSDEEFSEAQSIKQPVEGKSVAQSIVFDLPDDVNLTGIRLDLGQNKNQSTIQVKALGVQINPELAGFLSVENDFYSNEYLTLEKDIFRTKVLQDKYDPFLISKENFEYVLNTLQKQQKKTYNKKGVLISFIFSIALFLFLLNINFSSPPEKHVNFGYIALFFIIVSLPLAANFTGIEIKSTNTEKRKLADMPPLTFQEDFPSAFETYYNDNFGLRNKMVELSSLFKINIFNSSPKTDKVQLGKNQFLFYNDTSEHIYTSYSHRDTMSQEQLKKKYLRLKEQKDFLDQRKIDFILAVFPNKSTIYPENLPRTMQSQIPGTVSLARQYSEFFKDKDIEIRNVENHLLSKKNEHQLYQKFDSHWNSFGAYYAYEDLLNQYNNILETTPFQLSAFTISYDETTQGDLTEMLGLSQIKNFRDELPVFHIEQADLKFETTNEENGKIKRTVNPNAPSDKKILIFRDSFTTLLMQFMSLNFKEVIYVSSDFDQNIIDNENPHVVMVLKVERLIKYF